MSEKTVTLGSAWRKPREDGTIVTLPSGNVCKLRPVALDVLLKNGTLPDLLSPIAAKALWIETNTEAIGDQAEMAKGFADLANIVTAAAMLEPRVVEVAEADDEVTLDDIEFADKIAIFQLATGGSTVLRKFHEQQNTDVSPTRDSENIRAEAE